ncbi:MAG: hypothetical protein QXP55_01635 [Nitrososphaerales archaeon]
MLRVKLDKDPMLKFLFERSSLTQAQLDTYLIECVATNKKLKLKEKTTMRDSKNVSGGAFIRTLRQAQINLKRSVYTLILFQYLGLLDDKAMVKLLQVGNILRSAENINLKEKITEIANIIETIINTLSEGKRRYK